VLGEGPWSPVCTCVHSGGQGDHHSGPDAFLDIYTLDLHFFKLFNMKNRPDLFSDRKHTPYTGIDDPLVPLVIHA
jgi:hypothetical protein